MLCKISDLQPGDKFIWADECTRRSMLVDLVNGYRAKIITLLQVYPDRDMFRFQDDYGGEKMFCYSDSFNRVHKVASSSSVINVSCELNCKFCDRRYGDHLGIRCPRIPGGIFAPDIETVVQSSPDWLMEELGL